MGAAASDADGISGAEPRRASLRLESTEIADEIEFLLARARTIGIIRANQGLATLGLKVRDYVVLSLAASDTFPSQRELAEFMHLDPSQIVAIIDKLESRGLVERAPSREDRRIKVLNATAEGIRVLHEARAVTQRAEADSLASLTGSEREQLRAMLRKISFDAAEAEPDSELDSESELSQPTSELS